MSIQHSICFGVYENERQIGFARVISDQVVFAYIMDVFILDSYQGHGYGKQLMQAIHDHEDLKDVEQWYLKTKDAHKFYRVFNYQAIDDAQMWMKRT
jgi:N-acetylglutamate synthase-like GNAT family acetyltransferase